MPWKNFCFEGTVFCLYILLAGKKYRETVHCYVGATENSVGMIEPQGHGQKGHLFVPQKLERLQQGLKTHHFSASQSSLKTINCQKLFFFSDLFLKFSPDENWGKDSKSF